MLLIKKGNTPKELVEYKNSGNTSYESFQGKDAIRDSLISEQNRLCAYCMGKINTENMKIEHFKSQSKYPKLQLEYSNMLGCCDGGQGKPKKQQTCDTFKGDLELLLNPADEADFKKMHIYYTDDGSIFSENEEFNKQLNSVLNLNTNLLKNNRKDMIESAKLALSLKRGTRTKSEISNLIQKYKSQHKPYYGVAVYYLEKN